MNKYEEIAAAMRKAANPEIARHKEAYMRNQFMFFGVQTPQRRAISKPIIDEAKRGGEIDHDFLERCWADEHREMQYIVADYLGAVKRRLSYDDVAWIEKYIRSKQWWDTIDGLDRVVGEIAFSDPRINELMLRWSVDPDFWVRRVAIDHQLCRKGKTDTELLEKIIVNNLGSKEFFINKAIGWSLRDYSKTNPAWVRDFIERYRHRLAPLSIREGSKYI